MIPTKALSDYIGSLTLDQAQQMDKADELSHFRSKFHFPKRENGESFIYLCGNSLGLQPNSVNDYMAAQLSNWAELGVEGHFNGDTPWVNFHELLTEDMADIVGALPSEVVVMNTLSVNLHLMMVSFYRPTADRFKILIEHDAFPSDRFAAVSQIKWHGYDPNEALIELYPDEGGHTISNTTIQQTIEQYGDEIALIMLGNTNYYTGQLFDMKRIAEWGHTKGCVVGFDCAHAAGNVPLGLHDSNVDFAVWCNYKYINSGPGSIASAFVHERHIKNAELPKLAAWWGHNKATRFKMRDDFDPIPTVESWQLSCPPVFSMTPIRASLDLFAEAKIDRLRAKSKKLTAYLEQGIEAIARDDIQIITPKDPDERGSQLSVLLLNKDKSLFNALKDEGVIADWREPNVIRLAPIAMYNSFEDVFRFLQLFENLLDQ